MRIDAFHAALPPLWLTGVDEIGGPGPAAPKSAPRIADGDTVLFETVYVSSLPRVPMTEAHRRLEQVRTLVAARTDVPIHFCDPRIVRSANPYQPMSEAVLRFTPNPADVHAAATERAASTR
jgi:hypothetical protein